MVLVMFPVMVLLMTLGSRKSRISRLGNGLGEYFTSILRF